jgi:hypothetical protein
MFHSLLLLLLPLLLLQVLLAELSQRDWCEQQVLASANWGGHIANFFTGGLNLQVCGCGWMWVGACCGRVIGVRRRLYSTSSMLHFVRHTAHTWYCLAALCAATRCGALAQSARLCW